MAGGDQLPDLVMIRQTAAQLGVQPEALRRWVAQGKLSTRARPRGTRRDAKRGVLRSAQSHADRIRDAQRVVVEVARAISGSLDLLSVAKTVLDAAVRVVGSDRCAIYLVSADRTMAEPLWGVDVKDPNTVETLFRANPVPIAALPLLGHTLQHPEPVVLDDTETHPLSNPELFRFFDTRTVINVGLRGTDGHVFAMMPFVWTGQPHVVREDDVFFAHSLAALAEVALSNARLFAQIEQERARATIINDVVRDVNSGRDLSDTLGRAIDSLVTQLDADDGAIFLSDERGATVTGAVETRAIGQSRVGAILSLEAATNIARAIALGQPLLVPVADAAPVERSWFEALQVQSSLYVPLLSQGRLVGIAFANYLHQTPRLEAADERFVAALAAQCSLAIERVQLLEAASTRAAELEAVITQMGEGMIMADREGRIVLVNDYAAQLHGMAALNVAPDQYAAEYSLFRLDGTPYPSLELPLSRAVLKGETVNAAEWCIRRRDGTEVIASGSATPIMADDGTRLGAVLVVRDVTARRKLEAEKDQFLSVVSHELKTPLTTIKGQTELAKRRIIRGMSPTDVLSSLDSVAKQVRRMEGLIGDLLDIRRLEMGSVPINLAPHDVRAIAAEAGERAQAMTDRHVMELSVAAVEPVIVNVDRGRIDQVLDNMLSNAIKYSPDGGTILVELVATEQEALIRVRDQGIGIPEQGREHLFERFYRGSNVPASEYGGLGIGLALSREIVQRHAGRLELEATGPGGTTFRLRLPLTSASNVLA